MAEKQLLIESCDFSFSVKESNELKESLRLSAGKNDTLIVKNVPSTICNYRNQNSRVYPTALMQKAIEEARPKMERRELNSQACEHPEQSLVTPTNVSHTIINAYIKNTEIEVDGKKERHDVLFTDWLVLPTRDGTTLITLLKNGISVPVSIRGLGSCDANGNVEEYEFLGVDCVANASSKVHTTMYVSESVSVSVVPENALNETFIVSASATNVVHDLDSALVLQSEIDNANFGTVKKTSTKLDSEIDPKTGAETTMVTLETETEDEVTDIDQALAMAKQAIMNGKADIDSVTIENVKEEQPKESAESSDAPVLNEDSVSDNPYIQHVMNNIDKLSDAQLKRFNELKTNFENGIIDEEDIKVFANSCGLPALDDEEQYGSCAWCGDVLPMSDLKKEKDLGYVCNHCARGLASREGSLNFEECEYVPESAMTEAGVDKLLDEIRSIMYNEGLSLEQACRKYCEHHDNIPYEYILEYMRTNQVNESAMKEDGNENPYVLLGKICQNSTEDSWIQKKARQMANSFEHGEIDQPTFAARLNDMILANDFKLPESKMTEAGEHYPDLNPDSPHNIRDKRCRNISETLRYYIDTPSVKEEDKNLAKDLKDKYVKAIHSDMSNEDLDEVLIKIEDVMNEKLINPTISLLKKTFGMTEAKEEKKDPTEGQKYVLKTEQGFVAMDGNAIKFVEQPKDAIHFVKGKEESGVIHLSGINKILDTMGIYDVEKYYKKGTTDISAHDDVNVQAVNTDENKEEVKEGLIMGDGGVVTKPNEITGMPIKEDNGSNTRFNATVEIQGANGTSSETIPVSAVEMEGINNEVGNLYNMKSQKADGQVKITVTDTTSGEQFIYNPESQSVEPTQMQQESAGDIEQDGNKVSVEIDDKNTVEKEFENPAQASVVKAGLEQGKLSGDVLMSEDGERPQYQDAPDYSEENIQPGWYAASKDPNIIGIIGPFDSKEELLAGMDKVKDQINIRYVSPEEAGIVAESTKIDEVLYDEPTQASDPYIEEPMTDAVEQDIVVSVNNIDWNTDDLINKFMANAEADDPVNFGDIQSKINDLPDNLDIRITKEELPADIDIHALKDMVKNKIAKEYVMNINDLAITDLHSVN